MCFNFKFKIQDNFRMLTTPHNISNFIVLHGHRLKVEPFVISIIPSLMCCWALRNFNYIYDIINSVTYWYWVYNYSVYSRADGVDYLFQPFLRKLSTVYWIYFLRQMFSIGILIFHNTIDNKTTIWISHGRNIFRYLFLFAVTFSESSGSLIIQVKIFFYFVIDILFKCFMSPLLLHNINPLPRWQLINTFPLSRFSAI